MYLRRLVLTRRGALAAERSAIISQLAITNAQIQHEKIKDLTVTNLTQALLKNSAEYSHSYCKLTQAWGHGASPLGCWLDQSCVLYTSPHFPEPFIACNAY